MKKRKIKKPIKVTKNTLISEIIETVPEAAQILVEKYGIFCVGCPMASSETLAQGAASHGLTKKKMEKLVNDLNKAK